MCETHLVCVLRGCGVDKRDLFGLQFVSELRLWGLKVRKQDSVYRLKRDGTQQQHFRNRTENI